MNDGGPSRKWMDDDLLSGILLQSPYFTTPHLFFRSIILALPLFTPKKPTTRSLEWTSRRVRAIAELSRQRIPARDRDQVLSNRMEELTNPTDYVQRRSAVVRDCMGDK